MKLVAIAGIAPGTLNYLYWYLPLRKRLRDLQYFNYANGAEHKTRRELNAAYVRHLARERVEFLLEVVHSGVLYPRALAERIPHVDLAIHFFNDDEWQFDIFSRFICQYYHVVTTTDPMCVAQYALFGKTAVLIPWACNSDLYRKLDLPKRYDVTFIGQPHSDRAQIVLHLRRAGIEIRVFGAGWDRYPELASIWGGHLSTDEVVHTINESRICLNPLSASTRDRMVVKARVFEVSGCGSFQLCSAFDEVSRYYEIGKEIQVFRDEKDLVDKVGYYLEHEEEREAIARAGYERTLREHTWDARYDHMFREIERLRPQIPERPQPIISSKRVTVLYYARSGRLTQATAESLNGQTLPNVDVVVVSDQRLSGAEALTRPWRQTGTAGAESLSVDSDFVAFIEDGEEWEPEKLQFQAFALEQDAPKEIEISFAQWGVSHKQRETEFMTYVLRWLRDNRRLDELVPVGAVASSVMVTAALYERERPWLLRLLLEHERSFAEKYFRDRRNYSHIELGVALVRIPEARLWELIGSLGRTERYQWINSCLRYHSRTYVPALLKRLRLARAWTMWRAYRLRQPGRRSVSQGWTR